MEIVLILVISRARGRPAGSRARGFERNSHRCCRRRRRAVYLQYEMMFMPRSMVLRVFFLLLLWRRWWSWGARRHACDTYHWRCSMTLIDVCAHHCLGSNGRRSNRSRTTTDFRVLKTPLLTLRASRVYFEMYDVDDLVPTTAKEWRGRHKNIIYTYIILGACVVLLFAPHSSHTLWRFTYCQQQSGPLARRQTDGGKNTQHRALDTSALRGSSRAPNKKKTRIRMRPSESSEYEVRDEER